MAAVDPVLLTVMLAIEADRAARRTANAARFTVERHRMIATVIVILTSTVGGRGTTSAVGETTGEMVTATDSTLMTMMMIAIVIDVAHRIHATTGRALLTEFEAIGAGGTEIACRFDTGGGIAIRMTAGLSTVLGGTRVGRIGPTIGGVGLPRIA
jgi:hypothetical protein